MSKSLTKTSFVSEAESLLAKAVKTGDFDKGFQIINELYEHAESYAQVIGTGFDMMEKAWEKFDHDGETFFDAAVRNTKLNHVTIRNRINVSKLLNSDRVPEIYREEISQLGQKSLIRIANTSMSGYEIEDEDWERFSTAVSEKQVDSIARKIEGKTPRSNFVGLYYTKKGELLAFVDGDLVHIGNVSKDSDSKVQKGVRVLIARAKILDRVEY